MLWTKGKKLKISWVHLQAVLVLTFYLLFSKTVFLHALAQKSFLVSFLIPFLFAEVMGLIFLYLFSHESFLPVAREIEKEEIKKEKKWVKILSHHSRLFICLFLGIVGGPVLGSLTVRLLIHKHDFWYQYLILTLSLVFSTLLYIGSAKGLIKIIF